MSFKSILNLAFLTIICALFSTTSLTAQYDYSVIIEKKSIAFFKADNQSIRIDLDDPSKDVYVLFKTFAPKSTVTNTALFENLGSAFLSSKNDQELNTKINQAYGQGYSRLSLTATDFEGSQEFRTSGTTSRSISQVNTSAGLLKFAPQEDLAFVCVSTDEPCYVEMSIIQVKKISAADLQWDDQKKEDLFQACVRRAEAEGDSEVGQMCRNSVDYIVQNYEYSQYSHLKAQEKTQLIDQAWNESAIMSNKKDIAYSQSKMESKVDDLIHLAEQQWKNQEWDNCEKTYLEIIKGGRKADDVYNQLAEVYYIKGDFENFKKYTFLGVGANKFNLWLQAKMIRIAIMEEKYDRAISIYEEHKHDRLPNNMKFKKYMSEEIAYMKSSGLNNPNLQKLEAFID